MTGIVVARSGRRYPDTRRDEHVFQLVNAVLLFVSTAFWPWAFAVADIASLGPDSDCLPLPVAIPLLWALACAPSCAPLFDAVLSVLSRRLIGRTALPLFSVSTALLLIAVATWLIVRALLVGSG